MISYDYKFFDDDELYSSISQVYLERNYFLCIIKRLHQFIDEYKFPEVPVYKTHYKDIDDILNGYGIGFIEALYKDSDYLT